VQVGKSNNKKGKDFEKLSRNIAVAILLKEKLHRDILSV